MGATTNEMGACGCGGEDEKGRVTKDTKKGWFKGTPADIAKAKESGADVASGADAESATLVTEAKEVKKNEAVWIRGNQEKLEKALGAAPKVADATEAAALDIAVPLVEADEADTGAPEEAKPADAAKP